MPPTPVPFEVWDIVRLEAVLRWCCGRGAFLQSLDMTGVTEEMVLQGIASVAVFVV